MKANNNGIINILKPPGMTSHDVVNLIRKIYRTKKVGHTGTLDPAAAGVLPITVGRATKLSQYITSANKLYRAEITLGIKTDTQDAEGKILHRTDASTVTESQFITAMRGFVGELEQLPPMASAIKIKGKKLYDLHRQGIEIERPVRRIVVYSMKLIWSTGWGTAHPRALFDVHCSKGTYVRTLCHDLGENLLTGAHMSFLLRMGVGQFPLSDAITIEELQALADPHQALVPMDNALTQYPVINVRTKAVKPVLSGSRLYPPGVDAKPPNLTEGQLVRLKAQEQLLALARVEIETQPEQRLVFKPVCMLC